MPESAAHFGQEGGIGAITGSGLATHPGAGFTVDGATENAQNRGRDGVADPAAVFPGADIQRVMGAILDAPVLTHQFQEACGIGLRCRQTGNDPDGFDLLPAVLELTNAVNPRHLCHVRKVHLGGGHFLDLDAAPFDAAVALIQRLILRGKKLPAGSERLAFGGHPGCL